MALSDCPKCWDTPCTCGHNLARNVKQELARMAETVDSCVQNLERCTSGNYMHHILNATTLLGSVSTKLKEINDGKL